MIQQKVQPLIETQLNLGISSAYLALLYSDVATSMLSWQLFHGFDQAAIDFSIKLLRETLVTKKHSDD